MDEEPSYYAVIPANVRYDKSLKANEKLLYGEISALTKSTGECWASNKYFSELYGVKQNAVITWIRNLRDKGYIAVDYEYNGKEIEKRIIKIGTIQKDSTPYSKRYEGPIQKGEDNNTSINNKENINININTKERFKKPTLQEIEDYCLERHSSVDPKVFFEYFETGGWVDSKGNKVKNWKQKIITWERNIKPKQEAKLPEWFDKKFDTELSEEESKEFDDLLNI